MISNVKKAQAGFTLIEILVAFIILGLSASALMDIFRSSPLNVARAENERLAVLAVQSVMDSAVSPEPGHREGDMPNGIHWSLQVEPYEAGDVSSLYLITVATSVGNGITRQDAKLTSLRLKAGTL
jgi:general secretion pathway protein I